MRAMLISFRAFAKWEDEFHKMLRNFLFLVHAAVSVVLHELL